MRKRIIAVDFDGTLCEHKFPAIGKANTELINVLKFYQEKGMIDIILWTCRMNDRLIEAVNWCKEQGLVLAAVNSNVVDTKGEYGWPKIYYDACIDDRNISMNVNAFVDWMNNGCGQAESC